MNPFPLFLALVGALGITAGTSSAAPPSMQHAPLACLVADRHPVIEARLAPPEGVSRARVCFRARATPHWYYVELRPSGDGGWFSAALPRPRAATAAVEYYIEITGEDFESQRTSERTARVAAVCEGESLPPALPAVSVAVGALESGAPSLPAGFSSAGVVSLTAASAGGGIPLGLLAGGTAAAAVGAGAIVLGSGGGEACSATPAFHEIALDCVGIQRDARAGCALGFQVGVGRWATPGELQQALAGHRGVIAVDGQELPVTNEGPMTHTGGAEPPGLGDRARAIWTAVRGSHVVTGFWTVHPDAVSRCAFDVRD